MKFIYSKSFPLFIALLPLSTISTFASGVEVLQSDSVINMNEVVVTASNFVTNRNQLPYSISVVSHQAIEQSKESSILKVLSGRVPGFFMTERGVAGFGISDGGSGGLKIRGVGGTPSTQVLMLVDGQPQFAGLFGHPVSDGYFASEIERVEVVRGPASVLYGSNAMGGVVNVITRSQKSDGVSTQAQTSYGSYNTARVSLSNGVRKGRFNSMVSLNYETTDGHRPNSDFKMGGAYAKLGYDFSDNWRATVDYDLTKFKAHDPGTIAEPFDNPVDAHWQNIVRGAASFNLNNSYEKMNGSVKLFYSNGNHKIYDGFRSSDDHLGLLAYQTFTLTESGYLTAGIDYKRYSGKASNILNNNQILERTDVHEIAEYVTYQQGLFDQKLTLNAGLRFEYNSTYGGEWIPQGGVTYRPYDQSIFKFSVAKGYRNPTLRDLYITWGPRNQANPDLTPERMINYELSYAHYLLDNRLMFEVTGFWANGSNLITLLDNKLTNTGDFTNKGIELNAAYSVLSNLSLNMTYSHLRTDQIQGGAPKHQVYGSVDWRMFKSVGLMLQVRHINDLKLVGGPEVITQNYTLLDAKLSYKPLSFLELFVLCDNMLDQSYQINRGYTMPGIVVNGGVKVTF